MGQFLQIRNRFSSAENIIENFDSTIRKNDRKIFGGLDFVPYVCSEQIKKPIWELRKKD